MLRWEVGSCPDALVGRCLPGTEPVLGTWRSQAARPRQTARPRQQGSRYRGFPHHAAPLSRIPPANKNIIHAGPNGTAAKAGVRLSLREKTPFGAESKKPAALAQRGEGDPDWCRPPQLPARQRSRAQTGPPGCPLGAGAAALPPRREHNEGSVPAAPAALGRPPPPLFHLTYRE